MAKRWQKVEINYLKKHAGSKSLAELAERFHTDVSTVEAKLKELRLRAGSAGAEKEAALLARFEKGMKALYQERWAAAAEVLSDVAANAPPGLAARARQMAAEASRRRGDPAAPKDPYLSAVYEKNCGHYREALAACKRDRRSDKDPRFAYLAAASAALAEDLESAARYLGKAIALDPRNRIHALHDPDFRELRAHAEHGNIFST